MSFGRPHTILNWYLTAIGDLDLQFQPGLLAQLLRSSPHRRHVIAAIIAIRFPDRRNGYPPEASEMACELASGRLAVLLQKWLPTSPQGFLGALGRMHDAIENPDFYRQLYRVYSDPELREVERALRHVRGLNARMLDIVTNAPPILLRSGGWRLVSSPRQRDDLVAALAVIKEIAQLTDPEISRSLTAALVHGSVTKFIRNCLWRARLPTPPDIRHVMIRPLLSVAELHQSSRDMENCLGGDGFMLDALCGKEAFYIAESPVYGCMIARIAHEDVAAPWELISVHLKRNRTPTFAASEWVTEQFAAAGINRQNLRCERGARWEAIERLLDPILHDLDEMGDWRP
jgi:hypothetical protein